MTAPVAASWSGLITWLTDHLPATARLVNPPATAKDLRYLEAAVGRPLPPDLVELLQLANGTDHRAVRGALIPTLYNLVPVADMLSTRHLLRQVQHSIHGPGPRPADDEPAGRPTPEWLDAFLPIASAADTGVLYVDLRYGAERGCVFEWYPEGSGPVAPWWSGVAEMLEDVAAAFVDGRPALQGYAGGATWPGTRLSPLLPEVLDDDGYIAWGRVYESP